MSTSPFRTPMKTVMGRYLFAAGLIVFFGFAAAFYSKSSSSLEPSVPAPSQSLSAPRPEPITFNVPPPVSVSVPSEPAPAVVTAMKPAPEQSPAPRSRPPRKIARKTKPSPKRNVAEASPARAEFSQTTETSSDRIFVAVKGSYLLLKTVRHDTGVSAQLASRPSLGFSLGLEQEWSNEFQTTASISYFSYSFSGTGIQELEKTDLSQVSASVEATWEMSERFSLGANMALDEDLSISSPSADTLEIAKFTRPSLGVSLEYEIWNGTAGHVSVRPQIQYALGTENASERTDAHFVYDVSLEITKDSSRFFSSSGFTVNYEHSSFDSSFGQNQNSSLTLGIQLHF